MKKRRLKEEEEEEEKMKTTLFGVNLMRSLHWLNSSSCTHRQNHFASSFMLVYLGLCLLHVEWFIKPGPFSVLSKIEIVDALQQ